MVHFCPKIKSSDSESSVSFSSLNFANVGKFLSLRRPIGFFRRRAMISRARGSHLSRLVHTVGGAFLSVKVNLTPSCSSLIRRAIEHDRLGSRSSSRDKV